MYEKPIVNTIRCHPTDINGDFMNRIRAVLVPLIFLVAATGALSTNVAYAELDAGKAKQLYSEGVTEYNLGHYDQALTAFEMGYRVKQDSAFLFNIAQCQRMLNRYQDAERTYRAYLRENSTLPDSTRDQIQKLIADMQRAQEEQRAKQPPTGTQPPGPTQPVETTALSKSAASTPRSQELTQNLQTARTDTRRPVYKKPWFWATVIGGAVVVATGVALAVTLPNRDRDPAATFGSVPAR